MIKSQKIIEQLNSFGKEGKPFVFLVDFEGEKPLIFDPDDNGKILWQTPNHSNFEKKSTPKQLTNWEVQPVSFENYKKAFRVIQNHIHNGDTYLLNFTQPSKIETNLNLGNIFYLSSATYKVFLKEHFVSFTPEAFVKINGGKISIRLLEFFLA